MNIKENNLKNIILFTLLFIYMVSFACIFYTCSDWNLDWYPNSNHRSYQPEIGYYSGIVIDGGNGRNNYHYNKSVPYYNTQSNGTTNVLSIVGTEAVIPKAIPKTVPVPKAVPPKVLIKKPIKKLKHKVKVKVKAKKLNYVKPCCCCCDKIIIYRDTCLH